MFLKSIQHLSLCNDVTSSDKNIAIVWLKHIFIYFFIFYFFFIQFDVPFKIISAHMRRANQ